VLASWVTTSRMSRSSVLLALTFLLIPHFAQAQLLGFDDHLVSVTATCAVAGDNENSVSVIDGATGACFDSIEMGAENTLRIDRSSPDVVLLEFAVGNRNCTSGASVAFPSGSFSICPSEDDPAFPGRDAVGNFSFSFDTGVELTFTLNTNPTIFPSGTQVSLNDVVLPGEGTFVATGIDFNLIVSVDADADLPVPPSRANSLLGDVTITGATTIGDEDGDGVLDPDDLCPGSATSTVDDFGCTDAQNLDICTSDLDSCQAELAPVDRFIDDDGDGEEDRTDACAGSVGLVDSAGCDATQFCAQLSTRSSCHQADWLNNEPQPGGGAAERDCSFVAGACVPNPTGLD